MTNQTSLNTQNTNSQVASTSKSKNIRVDRINKFLDEQIESVLKDLEGSANDLETIIDIVRDRIVQSNDPTHVIALARLEELKLDTTRQRINLIKTVVTDKGNELSVSKRTSATDIADILNGSALGAAIGVKIGSAAINNINQVASSPIKSVEAEIIDTSSDELIVETEHIGKSQPVDIESLLKNSGAE